MGLDVGSKQKGHHSLTTVCTRDQARGIFVAEGKDAETVRQVRDHLATNRGDPAQVTQVAWDVAPAYISGAEAHLPQAAIPFDRSHGIALLNQAMDEVPRQKARGVAGLKATRSLWLKNPEAIIAGQRRGNKNPVDNPPEMEPL